MTRLTIFLGGGGVGKTTLSAGLGLALARAGRRVGLLSIDPALRLRSALGLPALGEAAASVPTAAGALHAAMLHPRESLDRWAAEACRDGAARARLLANPFFVALADRIAGATDAIAAARVVEWAEADPALDHLVVDTAPGAPAIEFLARPEKLLAFFDGRLIRVLRRFAAVGALRGGGRLLRGLALVSGADALRGFGEFVTLVDDALARMVARLERARRWLREPSTAILVVASAERDAGAAFDLDDALRGLGLAPRLAAVNRALPPPLVAHPPPIPAGPPEARAFARYLAGRARAQARLAAALAGRFPRVVELPEAAALDARGDERLRALAALAAPLAEALGA